MSHFLKITRSFLFALAAVSLFSFSVQAMDEDAPVRTTISKLKEVGQDGTFTHEPSGKKFQIYTLSEYGFMPEDEVVELNMYRDKDDWRGFAYGEGGGMPPTFDDEGNMIDPGSGPSSFEVFLKEVE